MSITSDDGLLEAFRLLMAQKVQSAPVWDLHNDCWIGWLELRDLVSFCVAESGQQPAGGSGQATTGPHHWLMKDIVMPAAEDTAMGQPKQRPHAQVAYLARRHRVQTVQTGQSLATAIHQLAAKGGQS